MLQLWLSGSRGYRARKKRMAAGAKGEMGVFEEKISNGSWRPRDIQGEDHGVGREMELTSPLQRDGHQV